MGHFKNFPVAEGRIDRLLQSNAARDPGPLWAWGEAQVQTTSHFCSIQGRI